MPDPGKRKLSAKQILTDIRSGMDSTELKRKYDLSEKGLESVCKRLAATGALKEHDIRRLGSWRGSSETSPKIPNEARWQCPACNTPQTVEMSECPVCGIVVEKFLARQGPVDHVSTVDSDTSRDAGPREHKGWMSLIISVVVFALVGSSLLLWSTHRAKEVPKISKPGPGVQTVRQPATEADQAQENSGEPESTSNGYSVVETGRQPRHTGSPGPGCCNATGDQ